MKGVCEVGQKWHGYVDQESRTGVVECIYPYQSASGQNTHGHVRIKLDVERHGQKSKTFRWALPAPSGWTWAKGVDTSRIGLYHYPDVLRLRADADEVLFMVAEGEKDADAVMAACPGRVVAVTTHSSSLSSATMRGLFWPLAGLPVTLMADADPGGEKIMLARTSALLSLGCSVTVARAKSGNDLADHLAAGHGLDDLVYEPVILPPKPDAAEPVAVDESGAEILSDIRSAMLKYMRMPAEAATIATLYAAATYGSETQDYFTRLAILAAVANAGKTTLAASILGRLCYCTNTFASATGAALARFIGQDRPPTLVLDEIQDLIKKADSASDDSSDALSYTVLKAGYKRDGGVRLVSDPKSGGGWDTAEQPVFAFAIMAGKMGNLPEQLDTRTITIRLVPAPAEDQPAEWGDEAKAEMIALKDRLARWAEGVKETIGNTRLVPAQFGLRNRDREIWTPLYHAARAAGWLSEFGPALDWYRGESAGRQDMDLSKQFLRDAAIACAFWSADHGWDDRVPTLAMLDIMTGQDSIGDKLESADFVTDWTMGSRAQGPLKVNANRAEFWLVKHYGVPKAKQARRGQPRTYSAADVIGAAVTYGVLGDLEPVHSAAIAAWSEATESDIASSCDDPMQGDASRLMQGLPATASTASTASTQPGGGGTPRLFGDAA